MAQTFYDWLTSFYGEPCNIGDLARAILLEPSLTRWSTVEDMRNVFHDAPQIARDTLELAFDWYRRDFGIVIGSVGSAGDYFRFLMSNNGSREDDEGQEGEAGSH